MRTLLIGLVLYFGTTSNTFARAGEPKPVEGVSFSATYYPAEESDKYGIIVLNGSAGGKNEFMANKFNEMGHPVLSLAYFDWAGAYSDALDH